MGNSYDMEMADGGYDANFDPPLTDDDTCCVCYLGYREPMLLQCGHALCRPCYDKCSERQGDEFSCPLDRRLVNKDQVILDQSLQTRVLSLHVRCGNLQNGCQWRGCLRLLKGHERLCEYVFVECPQCLKPVLKINRDDHVTKKCDYIVLSCGLCEETYLFKDEKNHIEECLYWLVSCTNGCKEVIRRIEVEEHLQICPLGTRPCCYVDLGCTFKGTRKQLDSEHLNTDVQHHMNLAMQKIRHLENELSRTKEKNENLEKEIDVQKNLLQIHIKESLRKDNEMNERLAKIENGVCGSFQSQQRTENSFVDALSNWIFGEDDQALPGSSQIPNMPGAAGNRHRGQSKYGTFIWKIKNYREKLIEGKRDDKTLYSEPFFSAKCGYKLRLELWLDGFGIGKGTGVSLYVQLMPGPHDTKLKWPFPHRITLSILNQSDETKHRERTYDPFKVQGLANELHFGRPVYTENKGYGCGTLITHAHISSSGFEKDNTILVMCKIHVNDL